ncbi:MAG: zinc ribbon domain-containing protein [Acidobacteriota bacterium]|nr:zinc ribbon domain-containing protein [Acidobacteriota bacterium]
MPLYEYRCKGCGEVSEFLQRFDDAPKETCPKCKGELERLLSAPAFHLKGSGWYKTDYATGKDAKKGSDDGGDSKDKNSGDGKAEKASDSSAKKSSSESKSSSKSDS